MRGATCAIFMMTFTPPADYERVHRNKVPLSRVGLLDRNHFIEAIKKSLHLRGELESNGGIGGI